MKDLKGISRIFLIAAIVSICGLPFAILSQTSNSSRDNRDFDRVIQRNAREFMEQGRQTFRFDTFGDETFWGDVLKLHQAIEGSRFGGVGGGVSPKMALTLGLKVDAAALPSDLVASVKAGKVDLDDPARVYVCAGSGREIGVTGRWVVNTIVKAAKQIIAKNARANPAHTIVWIRGRTHSCDTGRVGQRISATGGSQNEITKIGQRSNCEADWQR